MFKTKKSNPLLKQTLKVRFHRWFREKFGCIQISSYYGLLQAHCRRCGHENLGNASGKEWILPWNEYEPNIKNIITET